jgi:hypothetical protein
MISLTLVPKVSCPFATMSIKTPPQNVLDTEPIPNGVRSSAPTPAYLVVSAST